MLTRRRILSLLGLAPAAAVAAKFVPFEELGGVPMERGVIFTEYYGDTVRYGFADELVDVQRSYNEARSRIMRRLYPELFTSKDTIWNGVIIRDVDEISEGPSRTSVIIPGIECEDDAA